jgi:hypothetical protein
VGLAGLAGLVGLVGLVSSRETKGDMIGHKVSRRGEKSPVKVREFLEILSPPSDPTEPHSM